jgi:hypothetical protein
MIYHKFNGDFKSHINFERTKGGQGDDINLVVKTQALTLAESIKPIFFLSKYL